jgi:hypothetical protein
LRGPVCLAWVALFPAACFPNHSFLSSLMAVFLARNDVASPQPRKLLTKNLVGGVCVRDQNCSHTALSITKLLPALVAAACPLDPFLVGYSTWVQDPPKLGNIRGMMRYADVLSGGVERLLGKPKSWVGQTIL